MQLEKFTLAICVTSIFLMWFPLSHQKAVAGDWIGMAVDKHGESFGKGRHWRVARAQVVRDCRENGNPQCIWVVAPTEEFAAIVSCKSKNGEKVYWGSQSPLNVDLAVLAAAKVLMSRLQITGEGILPESCKTELSYARSKFSKVNIGVTTVIRNGKGFFGVMRCGKWTSSNFVECQRIESINQRGSLTVRRILLYPSGSVLNLSLQSCKSIEENEIIRFTCLRNWMFSFNKRTKKMLANEKASTVLVAFD